jgi:hypothetical protein
VRADRITWGNDGIVSSRYMTQLASNSLFDPRVGLDWSAVDPEARRQPRGPVHRRAATRRAPGRIAHGRRSAMRLGHGPHEREPKPQAPLGAAGVAPVEPAPDGLALLGRHARAVSLTVTVTAPASFSAAIVTRSAVGRVLERVVDEVGEGLADPHRVALQLRRTGKLDGQR